MRFKYKGEDKRATAEYVLVTIGRWPNTNHMGLESIGVKLDETGLIEVDQQCRTHVDHLYAIGDVVRGPALAHKASYEGKTVAEVISGENCILDYRSLPFVVFSDPEIATVGLSEREAKEKYDRPIVSHFPYAANGRAVSLGVKGGFVKLISEAESGVVLGAQVVGHDASNLIAELGLAIEMKTSLENLSQTIHAHPTLSEMVMEVAEVGLNLPTHIITGSY